MEQLIILRRGGLERSLVHSAYMKGKVYGLRVVRLCGNYLTASRARKAGAKPTHIHVIIKISAVSCSGGSSKSSTLKCFDGEG